MEHTFYSCFQLVLFRFRRFRLVLTLVFEGESDIGHESQDGDVDETAQQKPFPFHISFCGDIDNAGHQKPQAAFRKDTQLFRSSQLFSDVFT